MNMSKRMVGLLVPLLMLLVYGCGYHVAGKGGTSTLEVEGITTIAIPIFKNDTHRADVESVITTAIVDEFVNVVDVVDPDRADAVMEGRIKRYSLDAISYTERDVVREYRLTVVLSVRIVRISDGRVIWQDDAVTDYEDFTVDTSSVTATRDAELDVLKKLARDTARLLRERVLEGF